MSAHALTSKVRALITARKKAKNARDREQRKLIRNRDVDKAQMEANLHGFASGSQFDNFLKCGREEIYMTCENCGHVKTYYYACNRKWCPLCNLKIARERAKRVKVWTLFIQQPKHVVLTMRNFEVLTRSKIRQFQRALVQLRRLALFKTVRGGVTSIEITNEGRGWHLHAHCLLDVDFIDAGELAKTWGQLLKQEFGIVKVIDCRGTEFVQEVAKYVAKGSELASWAPERLLEFITAIKGCRFFFAFGSVLKLRPQIDRILAQQQKAPEPCACGCTKRRFETELSSVLREVYLAQEAGKPAARPLPSERCKTSKAAAGCQPLLV